MALTDRTMIEQGQAVERFLNDETIKQVFSDLRKIITNRWAEADTSEEREALWAKVRAFDELRIALQAVADNGVLAQLREDQEKQAGTGLAL